MYFDILHCYEHYFMLEVMDQHGDGNEDAKMDTCFYVAFKFRVLENGEKPMDLEPNPSTQPQSSN